MRLATLIIFTLIALPVFAQQPSRADLENRRKQLQESIRETEQELANTSKDKKATMGQLHALQNKLADRQKLISNINDEIGAISNNIQFSAGEVVRLRQSLETQKTRYAQTLRYAYETRSSYDMMAFLFSSSDFNDAIRRMKYLKKFRDYRKEQVDQIRVTQGQIQHKIGILNSEKASKDQLLNTQVQQKQVLQQETDQTNEVVKDLKGREKELLSNIEKNRKASRQLDKAISDIIRREIELARKKAAEEEKRKKEEEARKATLAANNNTPSTVPHTIRSSNNNSTTTTIVLNNPHLPVKHKTNAAPPSYSLSLTPEVAALSNNFQANRGKLPWPVDKGFIAEPFGRHAHSVAEKVMVENSGIEIQTSVGAQARAVFEGTVTSVIFVPGMGQVVLVNHGQYFTVYSRLSNVTVKKGEQVKFKQTLGTATLNDEGVPMIHFEIWKVTNSSSSPIDPAAWIAR